MQVGNSLTYKFIKASKSFIGNTMINLHFSLKTCSNENIGVISMFSVLRAFFLIKNQYYSEHGCKMP